jgi:GT2 family glycosyltransferase
MNNLQSIEIPAVSIITVGMNHLSYLKGLLVSLFKDNSLAIPFEMIYIDNCSSDGTIEYIRANYPMVRIYENTTIKGFGENNNYGVSHAKGKYIAIINPDIVILKDSIESLFNYMNLYPETGILVPKLLNPDMSIQYSVRSFISIKILFSRILSKGNDSCKNKYIDKYLQKDLDITKIQDVDWAIGAAMFMSRDFFNQLKGFDERYFLYMEDEDLCLSSWLKNMPVIYVPASQMIHNHLRASSKINKKTLIHIQSMCKFFLKNGLNPRRNKY